MKLAIGVLLGSRLNFSATVKMPSLLGIFVYNEDTSKSAKNCPFRKRIQFFNLFNKVLGVSNVRLSMVDMFFDMFINKFADHASWVINRTANWSTGYTFLCIFVNI